MIPMGPLYELVNLLPPIYVSIWQLWYVLLILGALGFERWNSRRHR
jgi:hypothetical protein